MIAWIHRTCFSHLELESQKNHLFLFLMVPLLLLAELNVTVNVPFLHPMNLIFLAVYVGFYLIMFLLAVTPAFETKFKYIVIGGMIAFSMFQLWLFRDYPIVYQIMYINLALSMIYLNGYLIMFAGIATAALTALGFLIWKNVFFPEIDIALANIPIILILQATVVLWGAAKIGARFRTYISDHEKMRLLFQQNEQQLVLIRERNLALEQHAKQVEKLAMLEERNRMARELHDTMGHALTSIIAGLEVLKHEEAGIGEAARIDSLLRTAREGLEDVRDHVHMAESKEGESLPAALEKLAGAFSVNANTAVELAIHGHPYDIAVDRRITVIRCVQESLTNAVRHGKADRIRVLLRFEKEEIVLTVEDNGTGAENLTFGFGLRSMQERVEAVNGDLRIVPAFEGGVRVECRIPVRPEEDPGRRIRILLAEDQELIAESLSILLGMDARLEVLGIASNGEEAVAFCQKERPDVVLMDIRMPVMDGMEATRVIKERWPEVKVVVLTTFQDVESAALAIQYGAEGYLMKSVHPKRLSDTLKLVADGGTIFPLDTAKMLLQDLGSAREHGKAPHAPDREDRSDLEKLSEREIELLRCLAEGLKYREIAERMHYSEGTVKNYVSTIYSKLQVENRIQAIKKMEQTRVFQ